MILFERDWVRHPTATVHYQTKNTSFLRLSELYKAMKVQNRVFHLTLLQPELTWVDPHDPNLDAETMTMVATECLYNPWYFFREVLRIPPQASRESLPFLANRGNIALLWLFFNHVTTGLVQPRQTGKSVSTDGLMLYLLVCGATNSRINMLTLSDRLRTANVARIKKMRTYLPYYMRAHHRDDADNSHELTCKVKDNVYSTSVAQGSEDAALKVARGFTAPIAHIDEGPYIDYLRRSLPTMLTAGNAARQEAAKYGMPYGTIITTTAGMRDTDSGSYAYDLFHNGATWSERMFDAANRENLVELVERSLKHPKAMPLVYVCMSHRQLGISDETHESNMRESGTVGDEADRDYFNVWTVGNLRNPIPTVLLERMRKTAIDPHYNEITDVNYILRWYVPYHEIEERMATGKFVLGMDMSDAVGRDCITMQLMDVETLETVASGNVNEINLLRFNEFIVRFLVKYPTVTLIPERRGSAQTMIDTLLVMLPEHNIDPYKRIYNQIVDNPIKYEEEWKMLQYSPARRPPGFDERNKDLFGFVTSGSGKFSRSTLYSQTLQRAASLCCDVVRDRVLVDEITGLVNKNGRVDHEDGKHDDMVIAWMMAVWFLTQSKNLKHYGISTALARASEWRPEGLKVKRIADGADRFADQQQQRVKQEIEQLLEELKETDDERVSMMLERRIKTLDMRLTERFSEAMTIDALINDVVSKRTRARLERTSRNQPNRMANHRQGGPSWPRHR